MKRRFRFQWGAFLMFIIFGGLFLWLFIRVTLIQSTGQAEGRALQALATANYARESLLQAERGTIVDRNDEVIVSDTLSYKLIAVTSEKATPKGSKTKRHVVDVDKTASVLSEYLPMEKSYVVERLTQSMNQAEEEEHSKWRQVEFGKAGQDISHETMTAIKEQSLPGIIFMEDKKRFYPNGVFASHLIGFSMKDQNEDGTYSTVGKMGLEKTYNTQLTGNDGKINFESDIWGTILPKAEKVVKPAKDGMKIKLTIDKTIQNFVEDAMDAVLAEYTPQKMLVIVANPKTGEILALSQRPTFNPETREGLTENWLNDAVEQTIEPGSPMKMFTLAAAIEEKKWDPNAYFKSGSYTLFGDTIRDVNLTGWGTISFLEGIQRSSNVGMAYLLERIGDKKFIEYMRKFGFGERVGIDLPNEASGIILDNFPAERLTSSYGQGSTVTPIQMIQAGTAIANNGVMMRPYVIEQIIDPSTGEVIENHDPEQSGTPISAATAKQVREILATTVTAPHGTAQKYALQGYEVGGKTGTAEIVNPKTGRYFSGHGNYLYSFLGMAPIDDPQLLIYAIVQQPKLKAEEYGSDPVSKVFNPIMESSLKYLNIVPDGEDAVETTALENYVSRQVVESAAEIQQLGFHPIVIGEGGRVDSQFPKAETKLIVDSIVLLKTKGATTLPDFSGWSKKMVLSFKLLSGLDIRINGEGFVTSQSISAGTVVKEDAPIVIQLQSPDELYRPVEADEEEEIEIVGG